MGISKEDLNLPHMCPYRLRYRSQFFYSEEEHYGTGRDEYDELAECVGLLLKLQADHEKQRHGVQTGMTGGQIN